MKKNFMKQQLFAVALSIMTFTAQAQVSIGDIRSEVESSKEDVYGIIRVIMSCVLFGGLIYVASALIGKREMSKSVVIGWLGAMFIWALGEALLA